MTFATQWTCADVQFDLTDNRQPLVMGILNVTPDSFSDGGTHNQLEEAVAWARQMVAQGAHIIDVGGESTRPGFDEHGVSLEEEKRRVLPVVDSLVKEGFIVSVDTSKPEVMQAVADLGAKILNDIRGFTVPGAMQVAAQSGCGLVVMHRDNVKQQPDFLNRIEQFLQEQTRQLLALGAKREAICWDLGFGFGKTVEQNLVLVQQLERFANSGYPVLMGLSRKSTIGVTTGVDVPAERIVGSVTGALLSIQNGAQIVRVHDCLETVQAIKMWQGVRYANLQAHDQA